MFKLTIKIPERRQLRRYGIFIINFEHISHLVLSSNINKIIKTVLEFFLRKDFTLTKKLKKHKENTKAQMASKKQKAPENTKSIKHNQAKSKST